MTKNPDVRFAKSIVDYIFRWMATKFLSAEAQCDAGVNIADAARSPGPRRTPRHPAPAAAGRGSRQAGGYHGRGDPEPGRRAAVHDLRVDHGAQRQLLQVRQLRHDERLRIGAGRTSTTPPGRLRLAGSRRSRRADRSDVMAKGGASGLRPSTTELQHMPLTGRARIRIALLSLAAAVAVSVGVCTSLERARIRRRSPSPADAAHTTQRVDRAALLQDLRALSDPALQGRRTGSPAVFGLAPMSRSRWRPSAWRLSMPVSSSPSGSCTPASKGWSCRDDRSGPSYEDAANVIGRIPGAASRQIVVSAHYDHLGIRDGVVYPGADDNASGVATLLAAARVIKSSGLRHAVVFAAFDAEELGLRGARAFVERHAVTPQTTAIDVNLDMVSRNDSYEIFVAGTGPSPWLLDVVRSVQARTPVKLLLGHDRTMRRAGLVEDWTHASDHGPFADRGVPYVYFGVEDHPDYHRPSDTADKINPAFLGDVADAVVDTILTLDTTLP